MKIRQYGVQGYVLCFRYDGTKFSLWIPTKRKQLTSAVFRHHGRESSRRFSKSWFSFYSIDSEDEETHQQHADHPDGMALVVDRDHHSTGIRMTPKVPPTFDGQSSWFEFEDLIDDWMGITTLTPERLGPSLKNALVGAAEFYKNMLNNADLRHPENGVRHFKDTLRPYFVKGVNHVFLWRFLQLFRCYRGNQEFVLWIGRFEVTSRRVLTAWMDLFHHDIPEVTTVEFFALLNPAVRQTD